MWEKNLLPFFSFIVLDRKLRPLEKTLRAFCWIYTGCEMLSKTSQPSFPLPLLPSVLAPHGNDAVADDMKNFAEQLKPLVALDKIDPRRAGM